MTLQICGIQALDSLNLRTVLIHPQASQISNMQFILKLSTACCLPVCSMKGVSSAPGGNSLGGVYAMKRVGEDSDYAFEFEEYRGDYQEFGNSDGTFEEREAVGGNFASYGDYSYAIPQYDANSFDYYN